MMQQLNHGGVQVSRGQLVQVLEHVVLVIREVVDEHLHLTALRHSYCRARRRSGSAEDAHRSPSGSGDSALSSGLSPAGAPMILSGNGYLTSDDRLPAKVGEGISIAGYRYFYRRRQVYTIHIHGHGDRARLRYCDW